MLQPNSPKPLYLQIKEYILTNIHNGNFAPGEQIPSERALSKQFDVSRLTVNKALRELIQDGVLYATIGKGTFVNTEVIDQELGTLASFTETMAKRGQKASSIVLQAEFCPASVDVATHLQIPPQAPIFLLKRIRMADSQPFALEISHLVGRLCPNITQHNFSQESLYAVLRADYQLYLTHAEQTIEARRATLEEAQALDTEPHSPILNMTRITYTGQNIPVEYVKSAYRGDRYKFRAVLRKLD